MKFFSYQHLDTDQEQFVLDIGSWEILHLSEDVKELRLTIHKHTIDVMLIHGLLRKLPVYSTAKLRHYDQRSGRCRNQ